MKAVVWEGPEALRLAEIPEAAPGPGEVVLRPVAGVCGSEVEGYLGHQANRIPPLVMGHEMAGQVVGLGPGAEESWLGALAAVNPIVSCRHCAYCAAGARNLCRRKGLIGIARPGGFAERVAVPAVNLTRLPDGSDLRRGAFVEPMANGVHAARLGLAGDRVSRAVVIGAGAIGLCAIQALRLLGTARVDVLEPDGPRRATAGQMGASATHADAAALLGAVGSAGAPRAYDSAGADVAIDAVGTAATRQLAADAVRAAGRVVLVGMHDDRSELAFRPVVRDEIAIRGSYAYADNDFSLAARWIAGGDAGPGDIEPARPLADAPELFARLARGATGPTRRFLADG